MERTFAGAAIVNVSQALSPKHRGSPPPQGPPKDTLGGLLRGVSTPEQDCIAFRSKDASMMPTRKPLSTGLPRGRQVGVRLSLGVSALLRRERRLL
jgi:hypothetical protein